MTMKRKIFNGSETTTIMRSQIAFNPQNPKNHVDPEIKQQMKNLSSVGLLGGIIWNKQTGHLVDGHRRVMAMDRMQKYDGSPETDYEIKVECVDFDKKTELNQLTYMAVGNTKADYNLIAKYAIDIDPSQAGLDDDSYKRLMDLAGDRDMNVEVVDASEAFFTQAPKTDLKDDIATSEEIVQEHQEKPKMTPEQVKAEKANNNRIATTRQDTQDLYVFLSFKDIEEKTIFCELLGYTPTNSMMVKGEDVIRLID